MKIKPPSGGVNNSAVRRLSRAVADGGIFHAYLFEGSRADTSALADWFTAAALCERRDGSVCGRCLHCRQIEDGMSPFIIRVVSDSEAAPEDERLTKRITDVRTRKKTASKKTKSAKSGGNIRDAQIEEVISRSLKSRLADGRVFTIIDRAETVTQRGQNRLLKTLEEPPEGMTIILLTENSEALLQTIRSRCIYVRLESAADKGVTGTPAFRKRAVETAAGMITGVPAYELWKDTEYFSESREKAAGLCEIAQVFYRDIVLYADPACRSLITLKEFEDVIAEVSQRAGRQKAMDACRTCADAIADISANVSMKHAVRSMLFKIQLLNNTFRAEDEQKW